MVLSRLKTGVLGLGLLAGVAAQAQDPAAQQQRDAQKQTAMPDAPSAVAPQSAVPDAPHPQVLPKLTVLTPVGAALPDAPAPKADEPGAPGAALAPTAPTAAEAADQGPPPDMTGVKSLGTVQVNFVEVPFTVKDSHSKLVPGITWRDVRVYENGERQQMRLFTVDPFPLSVALVIDQSVTFDTMTKINNSLSALQGAFTKYDEVAVFTYNNGVRMQTTFTAAQSARLTQTLEQSKGKGREPLMPLGGPMSQTTYKNGAGVDPNTQPNHSSVSAFETAPREFHTLLDAIMAAAQETTHVAKGRRRIVYVISDGKEYGSAVKEKEVMKFCQRNNVEVFATLVGDSAIPGLGFMDRIHLPLTMRDDVLPRFVAATGGQVDPEFRQGGIEKSFARITEEVRTQYTVGYYSKMSPLNESFRKIEVRVLKPNLTVIAKDGYYPSAGDSRPVAVTPSAVP